MELEVLLSTINLDENNLDKMNIHNKCTIINQSKKNYFYSYKNFDIYSYNDLGTSNSRNRGLEKVEKDIVLFCNDNTIFNDYYDKIVLDQFAKNKDADIILFNLYNSNLENNTIEKNKRLTKLDNINGIYAIAFKRKSILNKNIVFNQLFGDGSIYEVDENILFLADSLKKKLKIYTCNKYIGTISNNFIFFNNYNKKYFFDMGALYTAISVRFRKILMIKYLLRNKYVLTDISFNDAYKYMKKGSKDYLERIYY